MLNFNSYISTMTTFGPNAIQKFFLTLGLFILGFTYGQVKNTALKTLFGKEVKVSSINPKNGIIRCATVEYEQFLQENNPKRKNEAQFEAWLSPLVAKQKALRTSLKTAAPLVILTIPVVVHVIHNGEAIGTAPNITDAQIESQITVLNQDFRKKFGTPGFNSNPLGADVEIEFVLAKVDPNGSPTNGIDRVNMGSSSWSADNIDVIVKPATIWNSTQYMNMWSVKFSDSTLLGFAQFPDSSGLPGISTSNGASNTDGVVSNFNVFGSNDFGTTFLLTAPYNKGRTMSHEVGHFLGLRHIWGDATCGNDYCADTPVHHDLNEGCPTVVNCDAKGNEMVENYMDYTYDACMNIFTQNQKDRIVTVMTNSLRRKSLKTSNKGNAIPLFANDAEVKIEGANYAITIENATCNSFLNTSNKTVALYNRGTANSNLSTITLNYSINGGANQSYTWNGSLSQNQSAIVTLPNSTTIGTLIVEIVNVNGGDDQRRSNNKATATFTSAVAPANYNLSTFTFRLQQDKWGSETTWSLTNGSGATLYSGGPYTDQKSIPALITQNWTLASNQCYTFVINDSKGDGICCGTQNGDGFYNIKSSDGLISVKSGSDFGNSDTKSFTTNSLGTNTFEALNDLYLYPNPTKGILNISVPSAFSLPAKVTVTNSLGQIVNQKEVATAADLTLNTSLLSNGIYFITVSKDDQTKTLQFIRE
jgi:hypothetical protein